jgi:hypothetical protein
MPTLAVLQLYRGVSGDRHQLINRLVFDANFSSITAILWSEW